MRIDLLTALPDLVASPLAHSIIERAQRKGLVEIYVHDLRAYGIPKGTSGHTQIDDYPYGGGGGMVLKPEPLFAAIETLQADRAAESTAYDEIIYLTPDGVTLDQPLANKLSLKGTLLLIAGHYKGIDQRVRDAFVTLELSIGDYVLSGGELPALVLVDALCRLVPGVIGDAQSALSDSFQDGLLDAPVYTRPETFRGRAIPDVLRSGNHARIAAWREAERLAKTKARRPDLLD